MNYLSSTINQLSANFAPIRGIVVQNGSENNISSNIVTWSSGVGNNVSNNNLQGIRIESAPASRVWTNFMTNTAVGFYARGSSIGSKVECNVMNNTNNGFFMELADISTQGLPVGNPSALNGYSAHNVWNNTFSARTDGTTINHGTNYLYYYHANSLQLNSILSNLIFDNPYNWKNITLPGTGSQAPRNGCASSIQSLIGLPIADQIEKRTFEMIEVVKDSLFYDTLENSMKHFLNQDVFNRLRLSTNLLELNTADDYLYQNYLDSMLNTEYYKIIKSQEAIANKDFDSSAILISDIDDSDYFNDLIKKAQTIWNNSLVDEIPIASSDSVYLFEVACLDPLKHGAGVYIARSILDYDGWCYLNEANLKSMPIDSYQQIEEQIFTVAPNPSDGKLEIRSTLEMQKIQLIDLSGKIIETFIAGGYTQNLNFDVSPSLYILLIHFSDGTFEIEKIQVQ